MTEIHLNAPIQNANFDPDSKTGKVIPLLVADWMRRYEGNSLPPIDLWNNACGGYQTEEEACRGIDEKYTSDVLAALGNIASRQYVSDTDPDFKMWSARIIDQLLSRGDVTLDEREVLACGGCGNIIALADSVTSGECNVCQNKNILRIERKVLTSDIDEQALNRTSSATSGVFDKASYPRHVTILNKQRAMGIELDWIGLPREVLDPKVAVGLLALYAAQLHNCDTVGLVAARSNITHNLPQLFGFLGGQADELPQLKMAPIAKAPVAYINYLLEEKIITKEHHHDVMRNILPPHLLRMRRDMAPITAERLVFGKQIT